LLLYAELLSADQYQWLASEQSLSWQAGIRGGIDGLGGFGGISYQNGNYETSAYGSYGTLGIGTDTTLLGWSSERDGLKPVFSLGTSPIGIERETGSRHFRFKLGTPTSLSWTDDAPGSENTEVRVLSLPFKLLDVNHYKNPGLHFSFEDGSSFGVSEDGKYSVLEICKLSSQDRELLAKINDLQTKLRAKGIKIIFENKEMLDRKKLQGLLILLENVLGNPASALEEIRISSKRNNKNKNTAGELAAGIFLISDEELEKITEGKSLASFAATPQQIKEAQDRRQIAKAENNSFADVFTPADSEDKQFEIIKRLEKLIEENQGPQVIFDTSLSFEGAIQKIGLNAVLNRLLYLKQNDQLSGIYQIKIVSSSLVEEYEIKDNTIFIGEKYLLKLGNKLNAGENALETLVSALSGGTETKKSQTQTPLGMVENLEDWGKVTGKESSLKKMAQELNINLQQIDSIEQILEQLGINVKFDGNKSLLNKAEYILGLQIGLSAIASLPETVRQKIKKINILQGKNIYFNEETGLLNIGIEYLGEISSRQKEFLDALKDLSKEIMEKRPWIGWESYKDRFSLPRKLSTPTVHKYEFQDYAEADGSLAVKFLHVEEKADGSKTQDLYWQGIDSSNGSGPKIWVKSPYLDETTFWDALVTDPEDPSKKVPYLKLLSEAELMFLDFVHQKWLVLNRPGRLNNE
jgi:hypothetical protein